MRIIKPQKYTYDMLCNYEAAEQKEKTTGLEPLCFILILVEYVMISVLSLVETYFLFKDGFFNKLSLLIGSFVHKFFPAISVTNIDSIVYVPLVLLWPIVVFLISCIIPMISHKLFIKAGFLNVINLDICNYDWWTLKNSLLDAECCIKIIAESETEPEIIKTDDHITVKYKEAGYTKEENFLFGENTDNICKDNIIDFSVLDVAIDKYFRDHKIEVSGYIGANNGKS